MSCCVCACVVEEAHARSKAADCSVRSERSHPSRPASPVVRRAQVACRRDRRDQVQPSRSRTARAVGIARGAARVGSSSSTRATSPALRHERSEPASLNRGPLRLARTRRKQPLTYGGSHPGGAPQENAAIFYADVAASNPLSRSRRTKVVITKDRTMKTAWLGQRLQALLRRRVMCLEGSSWAPFRARHQTSSQMSQR